MTSRSLAVLPSLPEPQVVEIELTNVCNAHCTICPRHSLGANGFITQELYRHILDLYEEAREGYLANRLAGGVTFPRVIFAAAGEPILHRQCAQFVAEATARKFQTEIYSNAARLTPELARALADAGLMQLNISFWGTTPEEYETSMRLDFHKTLARVREAVPILRSAGVGVKITWQQAPGVVSTDADVVRFWSEQLPGIEVDMESTPENRAGNLTCSAIEPGLSFYPPIDFSKPIWCSFSYFTDVICWNGDVLMCVPDYFGRHTRLGNIGTDSLATLNERKAEAFRDLRFRQTCENCWRYRNESTEFWDTVLPESEIRKYRYDNQQPRR